MWVEKQTFPTEVLSRMGQYVDVLHLYSTHILFLTEPIQ